MLRLGFLYSLVMTLAGSPLLAENPDEPQPTLAEPVELVELEPTPARKSQRLQSNSMVQIRSVSATPELLQEKQRQLKNLQNEIAVLQKQLGVASQYRVECLMGEIDLTKLREFDPEIQWEDQRQSVVQVLQNGRQTIPSPQFRAIQMCLNQTGTMKTLMSPALVTDSGRAAIFESTGKTSVTPAANAASGTEFNHFGIKLAATVHPAGPGMVEVHAVPEFAERPVRQIIPAQGIRTPEPTSFDHEISETIPVGSTHIRSIVSLKDNHPTCLLVAITVTPFQADADKAFQNSSGTKVIMPPKLVPIPEIGAEGSLR